METKTQPLSQAAAYHRQSGPYQVSSRLVRLGGRFLLASMLCLTLGIGLDFYLIARIILASQIAAGIAAIVLVAFFVVCWFVLPHLSRQRTN